MAISALYTHLSRRREERTLVGSRWTDSGFVFTTTTGTPIDPRNALRAFYAVLKKSGLPRLRFHDLRHSAATLLLVQGVHPRVVMELLRHTDFATTMDIYSHVLPILNREAADQMDRILQPVVVNLVVKGEESTEGRESKPQKTNGRGEWIRTTDLLVPNQTAPAISLITDQMFFARNLILSTKSTFVGGQLGG